VISIFDLETNCLLHTLKGHQKPITAIGNVSTHSHRLAYTDGMHTHLHIRVCVHSRMQELRDACTYALAQSLPQWRAHVSTRQYSLDKQK
jgi:hypothetical protein